MSSIPKSKSTSQVATVSSSTGVQPQSARSQELTLEAIRTKIRTLDDKCLELGKKISELAIIKSDNISDTQLVEALKNAQKFVAENGGGRFGAIDSGLVDFLERSVLSGMASASASAQSSMNTSSNSDNTIKKIIINLFKNQIYLIGLDACNNSEIKGITESLLKIVDQLNQRISQLEQENNTLTEEKKSRTRNFDQTTEESDKLKAVLRHILDKLEALNAFKKNLLERNLSAQQPTRAQSGGATSNDLLTSKCLYKVHKYLYRQAKLFKKLRQ